MMQVAAVGVVELVEHGSGSSRCCCGGDGGCGAAAPGLYCWEGGTLGLKNCWKLLDMSGGGEAKMMGGGMGFLLMWETGGRVGVGSGGGPLLVALAQLGLAWAGTSCSPGTKSLQKSSSSQQALQRTSRAGNQHSRQQGAPDRQTHSADAEILFWIN